MHEHVLNRSHSRTSEMVSAALLVALLAGSAWVTIPLGAVPVTLQTFVVVLAALLLSPGWAAAALGLYLALGAIGLPIFSGAKGGLAVLAGPTGGYLIGFLVGAVAAALLRRALEKRFGQLIADVAAAVTVIVVVYVIGTIQLSVVTSMGLPAAIAVGAAPFLALDAAKAAAAIGVGAAVRRARAVAGV